jgi:hypothetical protein
MFDFYGMPSDWPGRTAACSMALEKKGPFVEDALLDDVCKIAGKDFRRELFIPYVQMHEFEALLFADVAKMSETLRRIGGPDDLGESLETIVRAAGSPEAINDNWETCPSRRILGLVPRYRKPFHGLVVAEQIGLNAMRRACPHFGQWVARLENLPVGKKE